MPEIPVTLLLREPVSRYLADRAQRAGLNVDQFVSRLIESEATHDLYGVESVAAEPAAWTPAQTLQIPVSEREANLLANWRVPPELADDTLEAKIRFLIDDVCLGMEARQRDEQRHRLYSTFGLRKPSGSDEDDEIPF